VPWVWLRLSLPVPIREANLTPRSDKTANRCGGEELAGYHCASRLRTARA